MAAVSAQRAPVFRFGVDDARNDLSLFNCSPMAASPEPVGPRLSGVYYTGTFSKNRRSKKLLERRDRLQQLKVQRADDSEGRKSTFTHVDPHTWHVNTPKPPSAAERNRKPTSGDFTDRRRLEFMARRKSLIQNQIKRQLCLPVNDPHKTSEQKPDVQTSTEASRAETCPPLTDDSAKRPGMSRRNTLIRTSSYSVRSANAITRRAINIIGEALEHKREKKRRKPKSAKDVKEDEKNLARKYSMMWMSRTVERKRMDYMKEVQDSQDYTVSQDAVCVRSY